MKNKRFMRIVCMILSVILTLGLLTGALVTVVSAATTYQLISLLNEGKIKPMGRTQENLAGTGITADFSGAGFELNVSGNGGTMTVGYVSTYNSYWVVLVDGTQIWRKNIAASTGGTFSFTVPAGNHTVSLIKETQINYDKAAPLKHYYYLTTLAFDGTIGAAPAKKDLYIEFVGDSYSCGDGALGVYEPGVMWNGSHDSATHGFPWYTAKLLNADYSIVARGGIGLYTGISEQEGTVNSKSIQEIYSYTSGHYEGNGLYGFERQPDVVVVEIGANDSITATNPIDTWKGLLENFTDQIRGHNPNAMIVYVTHNIIKYKAMRQIVEARSESDPRMRVFYFSHNGNGSAAKETQAEGHPNYEDHQEWAAALAKFLQYSDALPAAKTEESYTDLNYYVSENGSDDNDGTSHDKAMLTLKALFTKIQAAKGTKFAANTRIVIHVEGQVKNGTGHTFLGGGQVFSQTGTVLKNHKFTPILITTYEYSGTPATILIDNAPDSVTKASLRMINNTHLKDINIHSVTSADTGYATHRLFATNTELTIDNVSFTTDGKATNGSTKWSIYADHFDTGGFNPFTANDWFPYKGTVTFKNGDYTNLERVAAVGADSVTSGGTQHTEYTKEVNCKLVIEDGAKMGTVYNRYGTMGVASAKVEVHGGTIARYIGTRDNVTIKGDLDFEMTSGTIYGPSFVTAGNTVTVNGDINNTISGGAIEITPKTNDQLDSIMFAGRKGVTVNNVNNTISAGQFMIRFTGDKTDSGFYFGGSATAKVKGDVTNKISGGTFFHIGDGGTGVCGSVYFGQFTGVIQGTVTNEISGGTFSCNGTTIYTESKTDPRPTSSAYYAGGRGANTPVGKIVNIIGIQGKEIGPRFLGGTLLLGSGWGQLGCSDKASADVTEADCSDNVVISNTVYGGSFEGEVRATTNNKSSGNLLSFVKGSAKTDIYGGKFRGGFFAAGNGTVAGKVVTNIHDGIFTNIYGADTGKVYNGVELNVYKLREYDPIKGTVTYAFRAGGASASQVAVKLNIAPKSPTDITFWRTIKKGTVTGTYDVTVSGGVFSNGLTVEGKTIGEVLADHYTVFDVATKQKATFAATDTTVAGNVVVCPEEGTYGKQLVYYVSETGSDSNPGTEPTRPKLTLTGVYDQIVKDNGNSKTFPAGTEILIYATGRVNNHTGTGAQYILGSSILRMATIRDHVPITITTYQYNGTNKATIVDNHAPSNGGNGSAYVVNDIYFKDIDLQSLTNAATGYADTNFYAAGCNVTFDNCYITTDGKVTAGDKNWKLGADHFGTGGFNPLNASYLPLYGTLTFKNGDYTNLVRVAAVNAGSIWRSDKDGGSVYAVPQMHTKVIIEDGAEMGNVYNACGTLAIGSSTVEIRGGHVKNYYGTSSSSAAETGAKTFGTTDTKQEMNLIISGGVVDNIQWTGDANVYEIKDDNKVLIEIVPRHLVLNADINTTISGGTVGNYKGTGSRKTASYTDADGKTQNVDARVKINGDITTSISGGTVNGPTFYLLNSYAVHTGTMTTTISGGLVEPDNFMLVNSNAERTGSMTSTFSGGTVETGTFSLTNASAKVTGDMNNTFSGTAIHATTFYTLGNSATLTGNMNNTFSGTDLVVTPNSGSSHGIFFAGNDNINITKTVTNTVTAGNFSVVYDTEKMDSGIYFGNRNGGTIGGDLINKVSGGSFRTQKGKATEITYAAIHFAPFVGTVKGDLKSTVTGGSFEVCMGNIYFGGRGIHTPARTVTVVIGEKGTDKAPLFKGVSGSVLFLTGGWGRYGEATDTNTQPADGTVKTNTVVDLTIYGGNFHLPVVAGGNSAYSSAKQRQTYILGSVKTEIHGGSFTNFYASGMIPVYGNVTTDIYGGTFNRIYGGKDGKTMGKMSLTIHGMTEGSSPTGIWAGGTTGAFKDVSLTIDPKTKLTLSMPIYAGCSSTGTISGTNTVLVKGGTYTNGFAVDGLKVKDVLAPGLVPVKDSDQTVIAVTDTMTTTGTDSVTLTAADLSSGSLLLSDASVTWDGKTDAMVPTAIVRFKNTTLTEGTDYTLSYSRDGSATTDTNSLGTVTVTATGKGTYSGTASATYTVVRDDAVGAAIAAVTARVNDYHIDSVTQNDNPGLNTLVRDIQNLLTDYDKVLTAAEKSDLNGLITQVRALLDRIAKVSNDLAAAENQADSITEDTVTADDRARLDTIDQNLRALPDGNLTASQKQDKQETQARVAMLRAVIDEVESDLAAAKGVLATLSEATVTADDSAKLTKLAADLNAIPDSNLTAAQKAEKKAAAEQVAKLQKTVEDVNAALGAAKTQAFEYYTNGATAEDSTELAALMADIQSIPDGNLTSAQRTERDAAYTQVLSVQNAISNVQKTLEEAEALLSEVTDANVTTADVSRLDQMAERLNALPEANMTVAQRIMVAGHIAQIADRKETVDRVVKQLQQAEAEVARYAAMDLTADHLTELDELASHIFNMNTGNMTEAQKATRTKLLDRVKAMMDAVRNAGETLEQLKAEIGAYSISTIKKTDLEALDGLVVRLDAIPDSALNATQRAEKQSLGSKLTELTARIAQVMTVISNAETELAKYTMDNVSADDKEAIQDIAASLNDLSEANMTEEQKQAVSGHNTRINALLAKINAISDEMIRIIGEIGTYGTANVTSADLGDLEKLEGALEAISNDNLSAAQLRQKQDAMARIAELKAVIADVAAQLAEGRKAFEGITEANVTADHQAKILDARKTLQLIEDDKLTQAEREERQTLLDKAYNLLATIEDTEQALTAVEDQLRLVSATHATADDLPKLSGIKTRLEAISDGNLTAAQKARKEAALTKVAEAQAAVQKAAADLEALRTAVAKYSTETVTGDDMTALNKLMQDADAIVATNLTDSQGQEVNALKQTIQNLRDIVADVAAELAEAEDAVDAYDPATVTIDDRNDLLALADQIAEIADGNLYAGQKVTKKALADRVQAMLKTVEDATAKLTSIKTEAGTYGLSTVTADDLPAIEKMASDLAALKDSNLTAAQKSEKATVSEKLKALKQAVQDAADTLESAASLLHRYDVGSVTADEEAILELVEGRLLQVADGNLTAAQKAEKAQLSQQLAAMRQAITDAENGLAAVKEAADTYNVDTVNSTDTEALDTLEKQIAAVPDGNLTDAQKNEKKDLQTKVDQLQKRLADTAEAMKELQEAVEAYDPENLTPADKEALLALAQKLKEQPTNNLSAGEKATLQDLAKAVEDNLAIIAKAEEIAGNIGAIEEAVQGITEQNVTADDFADLQAAQKAIDELEQDPDLKQADKDRLAALEDQIAKAQAQLEKADEANDLSTDLLDITAGNVDEDDRATLASAVKKLQDALAAYGNNYTAAEKQEMDAVIADLQAVLKVLDQAKAVEQQLLALPATASPDDEAAEKALAEAAAALEALSDHQQTLISQAALDRMAGLEKAMGDYKVLSGHGDAVSKESGKTLTFVFNGNFKKFTGIQVDGTSVDAKFYTAKSGSTIITLTSDYLDSLAEGKHTLTVLWNDGSATAEFTVKPKEVTPPTGDDMNVGIMAVLAVVSVMAAASVALIGKKRRS